MQTNIDRTCNSYYMTVGEKMVQDEFCRRDLEKYFPLLQEIVEVKCVFNSFGC